MGRICQREMPSAESGMDKERYGNMKTIEMIHAVWTCEWKSSLGSKGKRLRMAC